MRIAILPIISVFLLFNAPVYAELENATRSAKIIQSQGNITRAAKNALLKQSPSSTLPALTSTGERKRKARTATFSRYLTLQSLSFFQADTQVFGDNDVDGYYHGFNLTFDADTTQGTTADVYALIYLSLDGGPWNYFHTTDTFRINGASENDYIDIDSVLEEGYPAGQYDVLIELYDAQSNDLRVDAGPLEFDTLGLLALEDLDQDQYVDYYVEPIVEVETGVQYEVTAAGSMGMIGLLPILLMLAIRRTGWSGR